MRIIPDSLGEYTSDMGGSFSTVWGGRLSVAVLENSSGGSLERYFQIAVWKLDENACIALATVDWGNDNSGLQAITVTGKGQSTVYGGCL